MDDARIIEIALKHMRTICLREENQNIINFSDAIINEFFNNRSDCSEEKITDIVAEMSVNDPHKALTILAGMLAGVAEHIAFENGNDPKDKMEIVGGKRKITIEAKP